MAISRREVILPTCWVSLRGRTIVVSSLPIVITSTRPWRRYDTLRSCSPG